MKEDILISIIVPTRNKPWETVSKSIDSIFAANFKNSEVILIDQNNNKEIKLGIKREEKYGKVLYLESEEVGLSRARNLGINHSSGEWFLILDDDIILDKDFFKRVKKKLTEKTGEEIVFYGKVLNLEDRSPYIKRSIKTPCLHLWNFDSVCSAGLIFNRRVIEKVGYFDEDFGVGSIFGAGEEGDIIIRALKKGIRIKYLKGLIVYHPKGKIDLQKKYSYGFGIGALYKKHVFGSSKCFLVLGAKLALEVLARIILGIFLLCIGSRKSRLHLNYLRGFTDGYSSYNK